MSNPFGPHAPGDVAQLVHAHPLALIVSHGTAGFASTPLPLLPVLDDEGSVVELFGHFGLSNPQVAILRANPRALIAFQGPHAYIRPQWVSRRSWAPTWNYALVRFETEIRFVPEENDRAIADLVNAMEGDAADRWRTEFMGERYERLVRHIVAFRARVLATHATFKLGQDEDPGTLAEILAGLGQSPLAELMREQNRGR